MWDSSWASRSSQGFVFNVHCSLHLWGIKLIRILLTTRAVLLWGFINCNLNMEGTYLEPGTSSPSLICACFQFAALMQCNFFLSYFAFIFLCDHSSLEGKCSFLWYWLRLCMVGNYSGIMDRWTSMCFRSPPKPPWSKLQLELPEFYLLINLKKHINTKTVG